MTSLATTITPIKVLFLDVDGVLCCNEYATLEPPLLDQLSIIIEHTEAVVAVSSDWRLFSSKFQELCRALKLRNIRVIGKTGPSITEDARPKEILHFITSFHARMKRQNKPYRITRWLAIDDRDLPTENGGEYVTSRRFVQTDVKQGLTFNLAMSAVNKLNRTEDEATRTTSMTTNMTTTESGDKKYYITHT